MNKFTLPCALLLTFSCLLTTAQQYSPVTKQTFESCHTLKANRSSLVKKQSGKLRLSCDNGRSVSFMDNESDPEAVIYEHSGDYPWGKFSVIVRIGYNDESFFLVNRSTCTIDTLIGPPVFSDQKTFAAMNNPGTDESLRIQLGEIVNGRTRIRNVITIRGDLFLAGIACASANSVLAKDNKGKYWKISLR